MSFEFASVQTENLCGATEDEFADTTGTFHLSMDFTPKQATRFGEFLVNAIAE